VELGIRRVALGLDGFFLRSITLQHVRRMFGFINVSKPTGKTSRQVVDRIVRCAAGVKAGHAGTLDPLASGVLVVAVGPATRLIRYVQQMRKRYEAVFLLGRDSPTEDVEGPVVELADSVIPTREALARAAVELTGVIMQRPPAYSALKVAGRRAYDLARRGETVELEPRPVSIHRLEITHYDYPELRLAIECSAGTYVRTLGRDLAQRAGTLAVMSALVRTAVGVFTLADSTNSDDITQQKLRELVQNPLVAFAEWPRLILDDAEIARIARGQSIRRTIAAAGTQTPAAAETTSEALALNAAGSLLAVLEHVDAEPGQDSDAWHPRLTFVAGR
jgi:tRNA pseudouridine55 synthase